MVGGDPETGVCCDSLPRALEGSLDVDYSNGVEKEARKVGPNMATLE